MWSYRVQNDQGGQPRWWLNNGSIDIAYSGESFYDASGAKQAAEHFKANAALWNYVTFQGGDAKWYWHARASNNKNVASGGRRYDSQANAAAAAESVRVNGGSATGP